VADLIGLTSAQQNVADVLQVAEYVDCCGRIHGQVQVGPELQAAGISNNLDLSAKRALSVANYLTSHGVKPDLVSVHALGENHPAASNDTAEGRAKNRRVEITLTGDGS
jgi:hypothetical protein